MLEQINADGYVMSESTLRRMLNNKEYKDFFTIDRMGQTYWITLNNDFRKETGKENPFVVLNPKTYNLLFQEDKEIKDKNLLAKYIIYLKYMCGYCGGSTDITANQFLTTFGYKTNSNGMKDQLTAFNKLLEDEKIISIKRTQIAEGKRRNTYTFIDK